MRIVHAADLHLDSPMNGLTRYEGAPVEVMRAATRLAMKNLIDLCLEQRAEVLLLAGDVFDGDWKDYSTGLFFVGELQRLRDVGTRVVSVRGNHDAASGVTRALKLPPFVHELSATRAETVALEDVGIAVHGQSFAARVASEDLARGYPPRRADLLNVGLLHTSLDGRPGHAAYAPTTLDVLRSHGYDYWALGHVHKREVVSETPWIVYPGNLQGRHARETGEKGATLITAENGRVVSVEHRTLDAARWAAATVALEPNDSFDDALERVLAALEEERERAGELPLAVRVTLAGATAANAELRQNVDRTTSEVRAQAHALGDVWVEKVRLEVSPLLDLDAIAAREDGAGALVRAVRSLASAPDELTAELAASLDELKKKLPADLKDELGPDQVRAWLADLERTLLPRLLEDEGR